MVKVFYSKNGQVKVTIPKAIAEAMQLKHGAKVSFVFNGKTWEVRTASSYQLPAAGLGNKKAKARRKKR